MLASETAAAAVGLLCAGSRDQLVDRTIWTNEVLLQASCKDDNGANVTVDFSPEPSLSGDIAS
jgi:hypothetical protein